MNREAILAALATRTGANRAPWPALPAAPYTLLADGAETAIAAEYGVTQMTLTVGLRRAVQFAGNDAQRSTAANQALDALIAAAVGNDPTLGGLCLDLRYVEGNTEYPTDGSAWVGAVALFAIDYLR